MTQRELTKAIAGLLLVAGDAAQRLDPDALLEDDVKELRSNLRRARELADRLDDYARTYDDE